MPVEFVRVKNKDTGAIASLPVAALPHFPDWERVDGPPPAKPKPNVSSQTNRAVSAASQEEE